MEKRLLLYTYVDGVNDIPFPSAEGQIEISSFSYDAKRMGSAPSINASFYYQTCIDKDWKYSVYTIFNGERYYLKQIPSSGKDNTDARYKYEIDFVSERIILDNVYVYDVVSPSEGYDKPVSNSSKFSFFGDIHEFVQRLNFSLQYCKVGYSVVVDDGITSEGKLVSFEDQFFSNAIQEAYNTYGIPYYFAGHVIHIGYTDNTITETFRYGIEDSLLSIQKQNANYKIITRITGEGSSDNIPYYYPNDSADKSEVEASGGTWIAPSENLLPPIYRETLGKERFYNAKNDAYTIPYVGGYYHFDNEYVEGNPKEHIIDFSEIKPTIAGMTNTSGQRIDTFSDYAYDLNDSDEFDEEGNYIHPYFFAKLRRIDGSNGFNLFDHAIDENEMTISMTSGPCGSCEWTVMVDENTQKNTVQVDEYGNLVRDEEGNVKFGAAQDRQNDTRNYEVWIALKKDIDTFGVVMPNAEHNYKPSVGDTFVILHIDLPKAYILAAEERLKEKLIEYMSENNSEKFNFSISFSRIYFHENPHILERINENALLNLEYDNDVYPLYVSSYSYVMSNDSPLPEIKVELSDSLSISQNALQEAITAVQDDIYKFIGSVDVLKTGLKYFLRKDIEDTAKKKITFNSGLNSKELLSVGDFIKSIYAGKGAGIDKDGNAEFESVRVRTYFEAYELIINRLSAIEGDQLLSEADTIESIDDLGDNCYGLHLRSKWDGYFTAQVQNNVLKGIINTLATGSGVYYTSWMRVNSVNTTSNYIEVVMYPDDEVPGGKNYPPCEMMKIARWGNQTDKRRQQILYLSSTDGSIIKLVGVTKPIIDSTNYGMTHGSVPQFLYDYRDDNGNPLPISSHLDYVYAPGIITADIIRLNKWTGRPISEIVDRGAFVLGGLYYFEDINPETGSYEISDVWYMGCKYRCVKNLTKTVPAWNNTDWAMVEGNPDFTVEFLENEQIFDPDNFNTTLTMVARLHNIDVTSDIPVSDIQWTRYSEDADGNPRVASDNAWAIAHSNIGNVLNLTANDIGFLGYIPKVVRFTVTATLRDGMGNKMAEDSESIEYS